VAVAWSLARVALRRRAGALAGLALLVAVGVGVSLTAFETAARTQRAYPDYLRRADVAEVVVNPSLSTDRAEEIIASTPGVERYATDDLMIATIDDGKPRTQREVDRVTFQVRMSRDGRYATQDRPVVHEGRMVRDGREAFLSLDAARVLGVEVGDEIPLAFWITSYNTPGLGAGQDDIVETVGRSTARVVGIGIFADEVLPDELYPRQRVLVTPGVAEAFTCTFGTLDPDDPRSLLEIGNDFVPDDCALAYRYFSLQVRGGDAAVGTVAEHLSDAFDAENELFPEVLRAADVGYTLIPSATLDERERLERSLRPTVGSLRLFGLAALVSTLIAVGLLVLRLARREERDVEVWRHLGVVRAQRFAALAIPSGLAVAAGILGAILIGYVTSAVGPVASARKVDPSAGMGLSGDVVAPLVGVALAVLLCAVVLASASVARSRSTPRRRLLAPLARTVSSMRPFRALGIRAALDSPGAGAVLLGSITAVGVVASSLVFSTSLGGLVSTPARYGWPYDAAVIIGFGYGGADEAAIDRSLDRPEVEGWGMAALGPIAIDGQNIAGIAALIGFDGLPLDVDAGRAPIADDEIALGVRSARELGVDIGDEVALSSFFGDTTATVTGTVVLPAVGPYESDRAATGTGVLLSRQLFERIVAQYEDTAGIPRGSLASTGLGAFVALDLAEGVDSTAFLGSLAAERLDWDHNRFDSFVYSEPVRPASIADAASLRRVPLVLGGFYALTMVIGLATGIAVATRARARELAILRALGSSGRELGGSVRWHTLTVVGVALVIGGPLGVLLGRLLYRSFADDVGVVPRVVLSWPQLAGVVLGAVVVGLVASFGPSRRATRRPPTRALRSD
jgi:hypothetical protein